MKLHHKNIGLLCYSFLILIGCTPATEENRDTLILNTIDNRIQYSNIKLLEQNINTVKKIQNLIKNDTSTTIFKQTQTVRENSQEVVNFINGLRVTLIEKTGGHIDDDPLKSYVGIQNITTVTEIMIGKKGDKDGMGYYLKQKVNGCIYNFNKLKKAYPGNNSSQYSYLALDAKDDISCTDAKYKRYDFAEYNFKDVSLITTLTELSLLENEILKMETDLLNSIVTEVIKKQ